MKDKISHIQIGMFLFLICSSIYLTVSDIAGTFKISADPFGNLEVSIFIVLFHL